MYPNVQGSQAFLPLSRILARLVLSIWPGLHMQHREFADIRWLFREDVLPDDNARPNNIFFARIGVKLFFSIPEKATIPIQTHTSAWRPQVAWSKGMMSDDKDTPSSNDPFEKQKSYNLTCSDTKLSRNDVKSHFKYIWSNQMVLLTKKTETSLNNKGYCRRKLEYCGRKPMRKPRYNALNINIYCIHKRRAFSNTICIDMPHDIWFGLIHLISMVIRLGIWNLAILVVNQNKWCCIWRPYTSSTAQSGGRNFKDRKL